MPARVQEGPGSSWLGLGKEDIGGHIPSSLTKRISNAPTLLRRMLASLYLSQKTYSLISLIQTQCLDLRVSQRLEAD